MSDPVTSTTTVTVIPAPVKPAYKTTEAWGSFIVLALGALVTAGIVGPGTTEATMVGLIAAAIAQLTHSASRAYVKGAANPTAQAGFVRRKLVALLAALGITLGVVVACNTIPVVTTAVIDCTGAHAADVAALEAAMKALIEGGGSWSDVEGKAVTAGKEVGGCALAELVEDYLGGKGAPPIASGQTAKSTLEDFRAKYAAGATFRTAAGDL